MKLTQGHTIKNLASQKGRFKIIIREHIDTVLSWETKEFDKPNQCRLRIYWVTWERAIVIATDIAAYPGRKIANVTQEIVRLVRIFYDIAPNKLMLIEHYSLDDCSFEDIYIHVVMVNQKAIRNDIEKSELTQLLGTLI